MKKDYLTQKEIEELEELKFNSHDELGFLDTIGKEFSMTMAERSFILAYMEA
mgnify:CR=1 FL=1